METPTLLWSCDEPLILTEPPGPCGRAVLLCLGGVLRRWCYGRRRARPPARLGDLTSFGAAPRSPPVPSGPSGALHTSGARCADDARCVGLLFGQALPPPTGTAAWPSIPPAPSAPAALGVLACGLVRWVEARLGPATAHGHCGRSLRSLRRPPRQWGLVCWRVVRCVASLSGQAPPPVGTAARQRRGLSLWPPRGCVKERSPLRSTGRSFGVPL